MSGWKPPGPHTEEMQNILGEHELGPEELNTPDDVRARWEYQSERVGYGSHPDLPIPDGYRVLDANEPCLPDDLRCLWGWWIRMELGIRLHGSGLRAHRSGGRPMIREIGVDGVGVQQALFDQ